MRLVDAPRCPYCARVRIALAEKELDAERIEIDLSDRPQWVIDLNPPSGRVPVLDDGFTLPESEPSPNRLGGVVRRQDLE